MSRAGHGGVRLRNEVNRKLINNSLARFGLLARHVDWIVIVVTLVGSVRECSRGLSDCKGEAMARREM